MSIQVKEVETYLPPKAAQLNAQKVLMWREEYPDEIKGMTRVGWTRANQLAKGEPLSLNIVKRMAQFNRHRKNAEVAPEFKDEPWKDAGHVAWLGWGGSEGIDWAIKVSKTDIQELAIVEITAASIENVDNKELLSLNRRLHQLWGANFEGTDKKSADGLVREDLINAYVTVRAEMEKRSMETSDDTDLARAAKELREVYWPVLLEKDAIVVPSFISIVGSAAKDGSIPNDVDLLIRADRVDGQGGPGFFMRAEDVELPLRKRLDPEKKETPILHWLSNPQGAHDDYVPLADLVLRWVREPDRKIVEIGRRLAGEKVEHLQQTIDNLQARIAQMLADMEGFNEELAALETLLGWALYQDREDKEPKFNRRRRNIYGMLGYEAANPPVMIDLGSGNNTKPAGYIGLDKRDLPNVDIVWDMTFGLPFPNDYADEIRATHALEHVADQIFLMSEIYRVLKPGGILRFELPSTDGIGAFADPSHCSYWNRYTIEFFCLPELVDYLGMPGCFDIEELHERRDGNKVYISGILRKPENISLAELEANSKFKPVKPSMAGYTEAFDITEILDWITPRLKNVIFIEPKHNGFRAILQKSGDDIKVWYEGSPNTKRNIPNVNEVLSGLPNFIADVSIGLEKKGEPLSRPDLIILNQEPIKLPDGVKPRVYLFDLLYLDEEDVHEKPLSERRAMLEQFADMLDKAIFSLSPLRRVTTKAALETALKWADRQPGSEGVMLKDSTSQYSLSGSTSDWAKLKRIVEIKATVLKVQRNRDNTRSYWGGVIKGDAELDSEEHFGSQFVNLGKTLATKIKANIGDVITVQVGELVQSNNKLGWIVPKVLDVDTARKEPYNALQIVDIAKRGRVWQERLTEAEFRPEETRAEAAARLWDENWQDLVAKGQGDFILHGHFPSLTEEESELNLQEFTRFIELLKLGDKQYHTDLRMDAPSPHGAWGFSVFEGSTKNVPESGTRLVDLKPDKPMRGTFKLEQPQDWLTFAKDKPVITRDVGVTGKEVAKFFMIDSGKYKLTYAREHAFEILLDGKKVKGRYQIAYVPVGDGRVWMISRPENQDTTFPQEHELDTIIKELKGKKQQWLFWRAMPDAPLKKIDVTKMEVKEMDFAKEMTKDELAAIGEAMQMGARLKKALSGLKAAMEKKNKQTALDALDKALAALEGYGYAYGYPNPGEDNGELMVGMEAKDIKVSLETAKKAIEADDWEAAMEAVKELLMSYGYDYPEPSGDMMEIAISESGDGIQVAEVSKGQEAGRRGPLKMRIRLIKPGWGNQTDKHYYPPEILRRDANVFEGAKMYATDHRDSDKSVRTEVSVIDKIIDFAPDGSPIAEVTVFNPDFAEDVRNRADTEKLGTLECSILAKGTARKGEIDGRKANVVEAITRAESVDWVTRAGAGGQALSLYESENRQLNKKPELDKTIVIEELGKTDLPALSVLKLVETEYTDKTELVSAITKEKAELRALARSGKPVGMGATGYGTEQTPEELEKTKADRFERIMHEVGLARRV